MTVDFPAPLGPTTPTRLAIHRSKKQAEPTSHRTLPRQRQCTTYVEQTWRTPPRIRECTPTQLQDRPGVAPDTHQGSRGRERKLDRRSGEGVIRFRLWVF